MDSGRFSEGPDWFAKKDAELLAPTTGLILVNTSEYYVLW